MAECQIVQSMRRELNRLNGHSNRVPITDVRMPTRNMTLDVDGWGAKHHYLDGRAICDKTEVICGSYVRLTGVEPRHACSCCQQILSGKKSAVRSGRASSARKPEPAPRVETLYTPRRFAYQLIKENP